MIIIYSLLFLSPILLYPIVVLAHIILQTILGLILTEQSIFISLGKDTQPTKFYKQIGRIHITIKSFNFKKAYSHNEEKLENTFIWIIYRGTGNLLPSILLICSFVYSLYTEIWGGWKLLLLILAFPSLHYLLLHSTEIYIEFKELIFKKKNKSKLEEINQHFESENYQEIIRLFSAFLKEKFIPKYYRDFYIRSLIQEKLYEEVITFFIGKYLYADDLVRIGYVNSQLSKVDEAIKCYTASIDTSPSAWAYNNRAYSYNTIGKYKKAIQDCTLALKLDEKFQYALNNRAFAYGKLRKDQLAEEDFKTSYALNSEHDYLYYFLGIHFFERDKISEAMECFKLAHTLNPELAEVKDYLKRCNGF